MNKTIEWTPPEASLMVVMLGYWLAFGHSDEDAEANVDISVDLIRELSVCVAANRSSDEPTMFAFDSAQLEELKSAICACIYLEAIPLIDIDVATSLVAQFEDNEVSNVLQEYFVGVEEAS
jgi:hypothetical protein